MPEPQVAPALGIPLPPSDLPYDNGEPLESNRHRLAINTLISSLAEAWADLDPFDPTSLRGWRLDGNLHYQPLMPNDCGWLWSQSLGFWLGTWEGTIGRETAVWLR